MDSIARIVHDLRAPDVLIVARARKRLTKQREDAAELLRNPRIGARRRSHAAAIVAACDAGLLGLHV